MSAQANGSGASLAQKYQEKVQARKRGAGNRETQHRGFSLVKTNDKEQKQSRNEVVKESASVRAMATIPSATTSATATMTTRRETRQQQQLITDSIIPTTSRTSKKKDTTGGLSEHFQERLQARIRGAGSHQPGFRNFKITTEPVAKKPPTEPPVENRPERRRSSRNSSQPAPSYAEEEDVTTVDLPTDPPPRERRSRRSRSPPQIASKEVRREIEQEVVLDQGPEDSFVDAGDMDMIVEDHYEPSPQQEEPLPVTTQSTVKQTESGKKSKPNKRKPTSGTSKPAPAPVKRRRLIVDEVDENEDPDLVHTNLTKAVNGSSTTSRRSKAVDGQKAAPGPSKTAGPDSTGDDSTTKSNSLSRSSKKPLRQTTLMHLSSNTLKSKDGNSKAVEASTSRATEDESDGSDSDFAKTISKVDKANAVMPTKKAASKGNRKGLSDQTVKTYKQLQIHCLKYWGPKAPVSQPAKISQQPPAEAETGSETVATTAAEAASTDVARKTVQSVLQIDQAPLSEMDVIADAVRGVVDKFIDQMEDRAMAKELLTFRNELETLLIEQVDMLDDHSVLRASVKKAAALKKELRSRLLETQRARQRTRQELKRVRSSFEREERARRRLEETHKFLTDLEALRDEVTGSEDGPDIHTQDKDLDLRDTKTGLQSLLATVGARCGGDSGSTRDGDFEPTGVLGALKEFNQILETLEKSARGMPLVSHSQQVTSTRTFGFDDDSD
ncbi:hypothetical protein EMPS_11429 [Entomortierella parvispora]|uniref:Inner kinetochore subunit AME1 domain-containing protein n=1 Tax=Entomortierella parvispora TaxID=205924 RepID=A0A9P3HM23_9FUNG|nr:hypothetical protein EMPS_11429 [Entomortierella parvispora]